MRFNLLIIVLKDDVVCIFVYFLDTTVLVFELLYLLLNQSFVTHKLSSRLFFLRNGFIAELSELAMLNRSNLLFHKIFLHLLLPIPLIQFKQLLCPFYLLLFLHCFNLSISVSFANCCFCTHYFLHMSHRELFVFYLLVFVP